MSWVAWLSCWGSMDEDYDSETPKQSNKVNDAYHRMSPISSQKPGYVNLSNPNSRSLFDDINISLSGTSLYVFTLNELRMITQNFSSNNYLGEGGFGPVVKGLIDAKIRRGMKAQPVAVKVLDLDGGQGDREWQTEIQVLGQLRHPHLVKLIGYCSEEDNRVLVYEFMPKGSLENQLFRRFSTSLPWSTRLKIALGAAKGLAFLHEAPTPIIYRDFKTSNILLDSDFTPKLSDFGLAKDAPMEDYNHVTATSTMGTPGYAAPEYIMSGHLTKSCDIYSFGVVLLELLTGRKAVDDTRSPTEKYLVEWARPQLQSPRRLSRLMDPRIDGQYSVGVAQKAALLAYQCLSHRPKSRPPISEVVKTLKSLVDMDHDTPTSPFVYTAPSEHDPPTVSVDKGGKMEKLNQERPKPRSDIHRLRGPKPTNIVHWDPTVQKNLKSEFNSPSHHRMGRGA
ncbi:hypothetical protein KSS87_006244 [Heliosperma pusillum]|nr:hypothetical protein KSS87_006244 [Heliosperma pusillum]